MHPKLHCRVPLVQNISATGQVRWGGELEAVNREAERLKAAGVDIIVCVSHDGLAGDLHVARNSRHVDLIVGGHSHTLLYSGELTAAHGQRERQAAARSSSAGRGLRGRPVGRQARYTTVFCGQGRPPGARRCEVQSAGALLCRTGL